MSNIEQNDCYGLNEDLYIGNTDKQLKDIKKYSLVHKQLYKAPDEGASPNVATKVGDEINLNESIRNYDFIIIKLGTRLWRWSSKNEVLFVPFINTGTNSNVRFTIPYSCYGETTVYTMELGFTTPTTLKIYVNGYVNTSGQGGYIAEIWGIKLQGT